MVTKRLSMVESALAAFDVFAGVGVGEAEGAGVAVGEGVAVGVGVGVGEGGGTPLFPPLASGTTDTTRDALSMSALITEIVDPLRVFMSSFLGPTVVMGLGWCLAPR